MNSVLPSATPPSGRPIADFPALAALAAERLDALATVLRFEPDEVRQIIAQMRLVSFAAGATLLREGQRSKPGHLLLLLSGEVSVDTAGKSGGESVAISVIGGGTIIGEMSLLDGAPHSATCIAASGVTCAALSRPGLDELLNQHPRAAAKLLLVVVHVVSERLRAMNDQLLIYAGLAGEPPRV